MKSLDIQDNTICLSENGLSIWNFYPSREAAEIEQANHPEYQIRTYAEHKTLERQNLITEPEEITEEEFMFFLEVLPPMRWKNYGNVEFFFMSEMWTGTYTNQVIRIGNKHYKKMVDLADKTTWMKGTDI